MILLKLIRNKNRLSLPTLVRRLEELESRPPSSQLPAKPIEVVEKIQFESKEESADLTSPASLATTSIIQEKPQIIKEAIIAVEPATPPPESSTSSHRHDVLLRFAAIELEGTLTKD